MQVSGRNAFDYPQDLSSDKQVEAFLLFALMLVDPAIREATFRNDYSEKVV